MARYLVTGGAGFIGSNTVRHLVSSGEKVCVIDNLSTGKKKNLAGLENKIELFEADIRQLHSLKEAMREIDFVIHLAALPSVPRSVNDPVGANEVNLAGTLNVLVAARDAKVERVVYASSSSVYGNNNVLPKREDMMPDPLSPYAVSKLGGEYYCKVFHEVYGMRTIVLRYFNVFGPYQDPTSQYSAVIPKFITAMLENKPITVFGDGEQTRDFTYVANVVSANLKACQASSGFGSVFNAACHGQTSLNTMIKMLIDLTGSTSKINYVPLRKGDVKHSFADIDRAQKALRFEPTVSFRQGLELTLEWYKNQYSKE